PSAPNASAPASVSASPKASSKRTADGSGSRVSRVSGRPSRSRCRATTTTLRKRRRALRGGRNPERGADAELREQPDQAAAFIVGRFVNATETLQVTAVRRPRNRKTERRLLRQKHAALVPRAAFKPIRQIRRIFAAHRFVAVD